MMLLLETSKNFLLRNYKDVCVQRGSSELENRGDKLKTHNITFSGCFSPKQSLAAKCKTNEKKDEVQDTRFQFEWRLKSRCYCGKQVSFLQRKLQFSQWVSIVITCFSSHVFMSHTIQSNLHVTLNIIAFKAEKYFSFHVRKRNIPLRYFYRVLLHKFSIVIVRSSFQCQCINV